MPKAFCVKRNKSESVKLSKGGPVIVVQLWTDGFCRNVPAT